MTFKMSRAVVLEVKIPVTMLVNTDGEISVWASIAPAELRAAIETQYAVAYRAQLAERMTRSRVSEGFIRAYANADFHQIMYYRYLRSTKAHFVVRSTTPSQFEVRIRKSDGGRVGGGAYDAFAIHPDDFAWLRDRS